MLDWPERMKRWRPVSADPAGWLWAAQGRWSSRAVRPVAMQARALVTAGMCRLRLAEAILSAPAICKGADPTVAHIRWELRDAARRVVRWVGRVARGMVDTRQPFATARFIKGGAMGGLGKRGLET